MNDRFDELPPAFQRYAHDEYLGGEGSKLRGISREEREIFYGSRDMARTLRCAKDIRKFLKVKKNEPISIPNN